MPVASASSIKAPSSQYDLGEMIGRVQLWRPQVGDVLAKSMINECYRRIVDFRHWYGLRVHGEVSSPQAYSTGSVSVTNGSPTVTGTGTSWTADMAGRQFRIGMTLSVYTIQSVDSSTQLTLDLNWGEPSQSGSSYQILQAYYSFGSRVKRLETVVNKRQNWRLKLDWSQAYLNRIDPQRARLGWSFAVVPYLPNSNKEPQWELYPWPTTIQAFPFIAYEQPAELDEDADAPVAFVRSDVILYGAIADALLWGKDRPGYDPTGAERKERQFQTELRLMTRTDDDLALKDASFENIPEYPVGDPQSGTIPMEAYEW